MSATKQLLDEFHQEFFTDDSYQDYLNMQKEHVQGLELEKINEELEEQRNPKIQIDWSKQSHEFFSQNKNNDLPF
jgi:hypothetical protein